MSSNTIVLGAGIIGLSTAYYLSQHQPPSTIHIVDPNPRLFRATASGLAAGFLARDWFPAATAALGRLSFDEHARLAAREGGREKWGYSRSIAWTYTRRPRTPSCSKKERVSRERGEDWLRTGTSRAEASGSGNGVDRLPEDGPEWLRRVRGDSVEAISDTGTTAQVDPLRLCAYLLNALLAAGVTLHSPSRAISYQADALHGELSSVRVADLGGSSTETDIPCTRIIVCAGAWTDRVLTELFPGARNGEVVGVGWLAGYSLIVRDPTWRDATDTGQDEAEDTERSTTALFTTSDARPGFSSELFTRLPGELYVAGLNPPALPLPDLPDEADVDPEAIDVLRKTARELIVSRRQQRSSTDSKTVIPADATEATPDEPEELRRALCFRPVTARGTPVVARIPDDRLGPPGSVRTRPGADGGVFVAAGHGPWGISLSLGTGMVMAEMVQGRPLSADVGLLGLK